MRTLPFALALALAAAPLALAPAASAGPQYVQGYGAQNCSQRAQNRGLEGLGVGALVGAIAGHGLSAKGHRGAGEVLGSVVGGVAGDVVGQHSVVCDSAAAGQQVVYANPVYQQAPPSVVYQAPGPQCAWGERIDRAPDGSRATSQEWMCRNANGAWRPA